MIRQPMFNEIRGTGAYRVIGDLKNTDRVTTNTLWIGCLSRNEETCIRIHDKNNS